MRSNPRRPAGLLHAWLWAGLLFWSGCGEPAPKTFTLATTTSVENSGLLQHLSGIFEARTGISIRVHVVGSGRALRMASQGRVHVTLTHDPPREEQFVRSGKAEVSKSFARNDFVVLGPPSNPARLLGSDDVLAAFRKIHGTGSPFASRGDESGTHSRELELWKKCGVDPKKNPSYVSLGQSMSTLLRSADQLQAYVLSDRATYLQLRPRLELVPFVEGGEELRNIYSVTLVRSSDPQKKHARTFVEWLLSDEGRRAVSSYRIQGKTVFTVVP